MLVSRRLSSGGLRKRLLQLVRYGCAWRERLVSLWRLLGEGLAVVGVRQCSGKRSHVERRVSTAAALGLIHGRLLLR